MPRISDHEDFLNATMVSEGDVLQMLDEGEFREPDETGFNRTVFNITVQLPDGRCKSWTMNKTTQRRLAAEYGDQTEKWVGKYVQVEIAKQNVRGEMRDVLYGHPAKAPPIKDPRETMF
jgi:hypothetical protein